MRRLRFPRPLAILPDHVSGRLPVQQTQEPRAFAGTQGRPQLDAYTERAKHHLPAQLPQQLNVHQRASAPARHDAKPA